MSNDFTPDQLHIQNLRRTLFKVLTTEIYVDLPIEDVLKRDSWDAWRKDLGAMWTDSL